MWIKWPRNLAPQGERGRSVGLKGLGVGAGHGSELANKIADIPWFGVGNAVIRSWRNRPIRDLLELSSSLRIG